MTVVDSRSDANDSDFAIKKGVVSPDLEVELLDNDSNPITGLDGATVRFVMKRPGSNTPKIDRQAVIVDVDDAIVRYEWTESDTDEVGNYLAEFQVDYQGQTGSDFNADEYFPAEGYITVDINVSL